jgi:hypothetical protein
VAGPGEVQPEDRTCSRSLARQAAVGTRTTSARSNFFTHISRIFVSLLEHMDIFYPGRSRGGGAGGHARRGGTGMNDDERRRTARALLHDIPESSHWTPRC